MTSAILLIFVSLMIAIVVLWEMRSETKEARRSRRAPRRVGPAKSRRKLAGAAGGR